MPRLIALAGLALAAFAVPAAAAPTAAVQTEIAHVAQGIDGVVGGPAVIAQWVRDQGVTGLRIDRDTAGLIRDFYGLPPRPSFPASLEAGLKANPSLEDKGDKPDPVFDRDSRDTATPTAMAEL